MKYIENILGDEKILHNIKDDDTAINYIKVLAMCYIAIIHISIMKFL